MTNTRFTDKCSAAPDDMIHSTCSHGHAMNSGCLGIRGYVPNCMNETKVFDERTQTVGFLNFGRKSGKKDQP